MVGSTLVGSKNPLQAIQDPFIQGLTPRILQTFNQDESAACPSIEKVLGPYMLECFKLLIKKSTLDNSPPPLLNLKFKFTRSNYWRKMQKIAINRPFRFFSAIIELVRELDITNMHNKFRKDTWTTFHAVAPRRSNYWHKMRKLAINRPF